MSLRITDTNALLMLKSEIQKLKDYIEAGNILELKRALDSKKRIPKNDTPHEKNESEITYEELVVLAQLSAYVGSYESLRLLTTIDNVVDLNIITAVDENNETCLHKASFGGSIECAKFLLVHGVSVDDMDQDGSTPLHHAANSGSVEIINLLVTRGADVNKQDSKGVTPLHIAVYENQPSLISALFLNPQLDPNLKDKEEGLTPLHHACFSGYFDCVRLLLSHRRISLNETDLTGSTPMHKACFTGQIDCVKALLDSGATVDFPDGVSSPLHVAAFGGYQDCVTYLLEKGARISAEDHEGATALHKAAFNGHVETVRILLDNGADIGAQDSEGCTPLHKATFSGQSKVVALLLQKGAEVDAQDNDDGTPLHNACFKGDLASVKLLHAAQASINAADANGASPLHLTVLQGHREIAQFLIDNGAQVDSTDDRGMTPLHHAITYVECLEFLIDNGADVNCVDSFGNSPLHLASRTSLVPACKFLILRGADPKLLNENNNTSLDLAANDEVKQVIQSAIREREKQSNSSVSQKYNKAARLFNQKPKSGLEFLFQNNIIEDTPSEIAKFLHSADLLDRAQIGAFLGEGDTYSIAILESFVDYLDFSNMELDDALRNFLSKFVLPGEAQKIDRMMERFAKKYCKNNPSTFPSEDTAYILSFSLIMLNTDAHNPQVKNKMTKEQFVKNNAGICAGKNLPKEYLESLYDKIVKNEIKMKATGSIFGSAEKKGWCTKQGGRIKTWKKRYMILKDNCLYYFKHPDDKDPCGIVPLENLSVRSIKLKSRKYAFELFSATNEIKACKKTSNGQLVKGHHGSYIIAAENQEEMESWVSAIEGNIANNPLLEMIKKRLEEQQHQQTVRVARSPSVSEYQKHPVDFQELHDACMMCSMGYKGPNLIKEAYGISTVMGDDPDRGLRFFLVPTPKQQVIVMVGTPINDSNLSLYHFTQMDISAKFNIPKALEILDLSLARYLRKDIPICIYAHSFGGIVGVHYAQILQSSSHKIEKIYTFGQPKGIRYNETATFKSLPSLRIIDFHDPYYPLFPGYTHVGPTVILYEDAVYNYSTQHIEDSGVDQKLEYNHVESYLRNLRYKLKNASSMAVLSPEESKKNKKKA